MAKTLAPYVGMAADPHPLNEMESALEAVEMSWVDILYGVRRGRRYIRAEQRRHTQSMGLATVHRILDSYRQQFVAGSPIFCIRENVPAGRMRRSA